MRFEGLGPVFPSVKDLAAEVANLPGNHRFAGKARSAESALNAIFREERPYTKEVQTLLRYALETATSTWDQQAAAFFQLSFEQIRVRKPYDTRGLSDFDDFIEAFLRSADALAILGPDTFEQEDLDPKYFDALVTKFGLDEDPQTTGSSVQPVPRAPARLTYLCSDVSDARLVWHWLVNLRFTKLPDDPPESSAGFTAAESIDRIRSLDNAGQVRVYAVTPAHCLIPVHLLNPFFYGLCEGWIHYKADTSESVAHLMPEVMAESFRTRIWKELDAESLPGQVRIHLADLGNDLETSMNDQMRRRREFLDMFRIVRENNKIQRDPNSGVRHQWRPKSKKSKR